MLDENGHRVPAMHLTKEQRDRVVAELTKNPNRLDVEIAEALGIEAVRVKDIRRQRGFPNYSHITRRKLAIQEELRDNPMLSNLELAEKYGTSAISVAKYREQVGIPPKPRGSANKPPSEGTLKCRAMLMAGTDLPDIHIAKVCGISFAHVARQRDLLNIPRSGRSNRIPTGKKIYDFSKVDADILANEMSLARIARKHNIPIVWVSERTKLLGGRRRFLDADTRSKIRELLMREERMTTTEIGKMLGVSSSTVNNVRKNMGVDRLPPGRAKIAETKRAQVLLSGKTPMTLTAIARESGLTVTTVTKIRNRMMSEGKISKPTPKTGKKTTRK